ncbi:hypothetical protein Tco_0627142 [Tanacetum coccineum]|uniref:Uncharacterized protein n=1 Tax=Tanacetum coccineum TaxID=301880 RepID=A0ABQ4WLN5_9ASTR
MDEEQRAQIARDEEIARQWDEEEGQRAMSEAKSSKKIDWNDPSVIRYHALKMKPKTVAQARRNMVKNIEDQETTCLVIFREMSYNEIRPYLHTLFEPDEESEIWKNQNEYNLISWSLCDICGVHILLMQNEIAIHMLTEKKYPLIHQITSAEVEECLKESSSEDKKI